VRNELLRWIELMSRRVGHGGTFHSETADEKRIVERTTASDWGRSLEAAFGLRVEAVRSSPDDPPDVVVTIDGEAKTVELVEFVDRKLVADLARSRKMGDPRPPTFDRARWSRDRLVLALNTLIDAKDRSYARRGFRFDYLLIHTDEPWLRAVDVRDWLAGSDFARRPSFANAHLLMDYDPTEGETWPLFVLYETPAS
jgi:hypothetical protein